MHSQTNLKNILVVNSYQSDFEWTADQNQGIYGALGEQSFETQFWVEHMGAERFGGPEYEKRLLSHYRYKYAGKRIDLVIGTDDAAFEFLIRHHADVAPGAPVVFSGVNRRETVARADRTAFTGVIEGFGTDALLSIGLRFHPRTKRVYVVTDNSLPGLAQRTELEGEAGRYPQLAFTYLNGADLKLAEIETALAGIRAEESLVILSNFRRDGDGRFYPATFAVNKLAAATSAPIYSPSISDLGQGIVGGSANGGFRHGRLAGEVAARILMGAAPANVPITVDDENSFVFDHRQLIRWGISESRLPPGSIVVNRPAGVYSRYKPWILGGLAFIVLQAGAIWALVRAIGRRKRAERKLLAQGKELEEKSRFLSGIINNTEAAVSVKDASGRYLLVNRFFERGFGMPREQVLGKTDHDLTSRGWTDKFWKNDAKVLQSGQPGEYEETIPMEGGGDRTFIAVVFPLFDEAGGAYAVCGIRTDITRRKRMEERIRQLAEGVYQVGGERLLEEMTLHLTKSLDADFAFLGELTPQRNDRIATRVVYEEGDRVANFEYELRYTPCEEVVGKTVCVIPGRVREQFPLDEMLVDMDIEAYAGAPLFDSAGAAKGLLVVLFRRPIEDEDLVRSLLSVFAARIEAELERLDAESELLTSRESLRALSARQEAVREEERARIAREIHDELGQQLTAIKLELLAMRDRLPGSDSAGWRELTSMVDGTIRSVKRIATDLRPAVLDYLGLSAAVEWQVNQFQERTGIRCSLALDQWRTDSPLAVVCFRILQEALTNVARHADASNVRVWLYHRDGQLRLGVEDDGKGMPSAARFTGKSLGLLGMKERAQMAGGELQIESTPGMGTIVQASFPMEGVRMAASVVEA